MKDMKYINLVQIRPVVLEIRGVENGDLAVRAITLVCSTSFLANNARLCVLIYVAS